MKKLLLVFLGAIISSAFLIFGLYREEKQKDKFNKEKISASQAAKEKEQALSYVIDSLKTEILYSKIKNLLSNAHHFSDLGHIAKLIWDLPGSSYASLMSSHPDVKKQLHKLGLKFFNSDVRTISSQEEFKGFHDSHRLILTLVPLNSLELRGAEDIYQKKSKKFGK